MDAHELARVIAAKPDAGWRWVQGTVVSVQVYSITVTLAGGATSVAGVKYLAPGPPLPGAGVWLLSDGKDLLAVGMVASSGRSVAPRAYRTALLSVANTTDTAVTWQAADGNALSSWAAGSPTRLTVQVPGRYMVTASMRWAANGTGFRTGEIRVNGTTIIGREAQPFVAAGSPTQYTIASQPISMAIGDYVELIAWQNSGAALDLAYQNDYSNSLALEYLGP